MLALLALLLFGLQPAQAKQVAVAPDQVKAEKLSCEALAYLGKHGLEVEFTGNEAFSSQELLALLASDRSALEYLTEGVESPDHLDISLRLFGRRLASRGYIQATFGETRIERTAADGHKFIIAVKEGARYRIGKVTFAVDEAKLFSPEQLSEMCPLKRGDIANGDALRQFLLDHLMKIYFENGYLQYTGEPEPTYHISPHNAREGIVDVQITIDEGKRFNVLSVEFAGNAETPDPVLRRALRLREDRPFRMSLLEKSLKNIAELNLFEELSIDRDVDYAFDEERARVLVKINLKEKKQP
jgi:outer membrane protein insertion porin family